MNFITEIKYFQGGSFQLSSKDKCKQTACKSIGGKAVSWAILSFTSDCATRDPSPYLIGFQGSKELQGFFVLCCFALLFCFLFSVEPVNL